MKGEMRMPEDLFSMKFFSISSTCTVLKLLHRFGYLDQINCSGFTLLLMVLSRDTLYMEVLSRMKHTL